MVAVVVADDVVVEVAAVANCEGTVKKLVHQQKSGQISSEPAGDEKARRFAVDFGQQN